MDCRACNGSGKVPSYRESAKVIETNLAPKISLWSRVRSAMGRVRWRGFVLPVVGWCVGTPVAVALFWYGVVRLKAIADATERHQQQWVDKMGYVVAQYDPENASEIRCWIMPPRTHQGSYETQVDGPTLPYDNMPNIRWIEVPDRNDVAGFAHHIGVKDPAKCDRW